MPETLANLIAPKPRKAKEIPQSKRIAALHQIIDDLAPEILAADYTVKLELYLNDRSVDARLTRFLSKRFIALKDIVS